MHHITLYPSLICADLLNLEKTITTLEPHCDGFHLDIMDFHFVPNFSWGPPVINAIAAKSNKPLFVHLMIERPSVIISRLRLRPGDCLSFHIESIKNFNDIKNILKEKKLKLSIAIKPKTPLSALFEIAHLIDHVLVMSVEPGFSGQQFMPTALNRVEELKAYREALSLSFEIGLDGGINAHTLMDALNAGATDFAVGSALFAHQNPVQALKELHSIQREHTIRNEHHTLA